jgi:hypothetical protein
MIDREPTDHEIRLVIQLLRVAELLPLDVALEVLMTTVSLLIHGSGQSSHLWAQLAVQVEDQRCRTDRTATHSSPARMQ